MVMLALKPRGLAGNSTRMAVAPARPAAVPWSGRSQGRSTRTPSPWAR